MTPGWAGSIPVCSTHPDAHLEDTVTAIIRAIVLTIVREVTRQMTRDALAQRKANR